MSHVPSFPAGPAVPVPELPAAACRGYDTDWWFTTSRRAARALAVCDGCPERDPCLEYATATGQVGVWGGTTEDERAWLRERRKRERQSQQRLRRLRRQRLADAG